MYFSASLRYCIGLIQGVSQYCFALSAWNSLVGASRHILHCCREEKAPSIGVNCPPRVVPSVEY